MTPTTLRSKPSRLLAAPTRPPVLAALPGVSYDGVTGNISFADGAKDATRDVAFIKYCNTETGVWDLIGDQGVE